MKTIGTKKSLSRPVSYWATLWVLASGICLITLTAGFGQAALAMPLADPTFEEMPAGLDYSFSPRLRGFWDGVSWLAVQADGEILAVGSGQVVRLASNGSLHPSFKPSLNYAAGPVLVQADGKILLNGEFCVR